MRFQGPSQVDQVHLSGQGPGNPLIFCSLLLCHEPRNSPDVICKADALVDSGCSYELILPGRKARHLGLEFVGQSLARGHGGGQTILLDFKPIRVSIKLEDDDKSTRTKVSKQLLANINLFYKFRLQKIICALFLQTAYLTPVCAKTEYDQAEPLHESKAAWEEYPKQVELGKSYKCELAKSTFERRYQVTLFLARS